MSSLARLRSFAESRSCPDHAIIQAGLTYGDARMLFTGIVCMRAELAEAEQQRDAARLELRALEWIMNESAFENSLVWRRKGRLWTGDDVEDEVEHPTYASAARALGWEG